MVRSLVATGACWAGVQAAASPSVSYSDGNTRMAHEHNPCSALPYAPSPRHLPPAHRRGRGCTRC